MNLDFRRLGKVYFRRLSYKKDSFIYTSFFLHVKDEVVP